MVEHPKNRFILLTVGRLHPVKDHQFLVEACAELKRKEARFLCLIAGEGETRKETSKLIERMGLQLDVKLLGALDGLFVDLFYQFADLFVLTSKSEGLPLTLMEAMLNERIVLAPNITGMPEVIRDGENGFLYESKNLQDFVSRVLFIFQNYESIRPIGKQAREDILRKFDRRRNMGDFADKFVERLRLAMEGDKIKRPTG